MADENAEKDEKPKSGMMMSLIIAGAVGVVCLGLGFGMATMLAGKAEAESTPEAEVVEPVFVEFGEVVANLSGGRSSRYLRIKVTLQVDGKHTETAEADVEKSKSIMRNWVLGYLSDLQLEDIKGTAGQNRIRREIQNRFNDILAPDGMDYVQDILFEEFTIQ